MLAQGRPCISRDEIVRDGPRKFILDGEAVFNPRFFLEQLVYVEDLEDKHIELNLIGEHGLTPEKVAGYFTGLVGDFLSRKTGEKGGAQRWGTVSLPGILRPLFGNYVAETADIDKHYKMIIKTVLSRGNWEQVEWVLHHYGPEMVRGVFREDYFGLQNLPEPARRLWELVFLTEEERLSPPMPRARGFCPPFEYPPPN